MDDLLAGCAILDGEGLTSAFGHLSARTAADEVCISSNAGPGLVRDADEVQQLEQQVTDDLAEYCRLASDLGYHAELRTGLGPEVVTELHRACLEVAREFPRCVFFAGQLVFGDDLDGFLGRFLHNHTAFEMLRLLQFQGLSLVILPVRVSPRANSGAGAAPVVGAQASSLASSTRS